MPQKMARDQGLGDTAALMSHGQSRKPAGRGGQGPAPSDNQENNQMEDSRCHQKILPSRGAYIVDGVTQKIDGGLAKSTLGRVDH